MIKAKFNCMMLTDDENGVWLGYSFPKKRRLLRLHSRCDGRFFERLFCGCSGLDIARCRRSVGRPISCFPRIPDSFGTSPVKAVSCVR